MTGWEFHEGEFSVGKIWAQWQLNLGVFGMAMAVHFLAYAVTGLPLFLVFYRRPSSPLWRFPVVLVLGFFSGW